MKAEEKLLLKADNLLLNGEYEKAMETIKNLVSISPEKPNRLPEDFNLQILLLMRLQRIFITTGNKVPAPLEKLVRYYEIISRNHPDDEIELSGEEARICGLVLEWLPVVSANGEAAPADAARAEELAAAVRDLLDANKDKYKLGVFYKKGF